MRLVCSSEQRQRGMNRACFGESAGSVSLRTRAARSDDHVDTRHDHHSRPMSAERRPQLTLVRHWPAAEQDAQAGHGDRKQTGDGDEGGGDWRKNSVDCGRERERQTTGITNESEKPFGRRQQGRKKQNNTERG